MADLNVAIEMIGRDNASGPVSKVISSLSGISEAAAKPVGILSGLTNTLGKIGLAGMGFTTLAGAVGGFATSMVSGNAQMETYETQLGTLMGSADAAKGRLKELADFGARTPFELPEIAAAEKVLLGFGLTGEKVMNLTGKSASEFREVVGDVAAGTGVSFQEIALTMGKFSSGATGEAISRLQEMGVATREQLAGMGVEFSKSGELLSPLPVAMQAITQLAQQKFGGGMDKLSKTFSGQMSTLSDGINQAKNAVMQPIFNVLRDSLASVNETISSGTFQAGIQNVAAVIADLVQRGIALAIQGFQNLRTIVADVVAQIGPTVATLAGHFQSLIATFQQGGFAAIWQQVAAAMSDFAPTGERISSVINTIVTAIKALVPQPIQDFVANLIQSANAATQGTTPLQALANIVNTFSGYLEDATKFVKDHVAVQAGLVSILTAAGIAWGISMAVQAYATAIGIAQAAVKTYTAVQLALNVVLTANPIGLVIVALAALAAGLVYAYHNSEDFRRVVDETFATLKTVVTNAIAAAKIALETLQAVFTRTSQLVRDFQSAAKDAFSNISSTITGVMNTVTSTITNGWDSITRTVGDALQDIENANRTGWNTVDSFISGIQDSIQTTIMTVWNALPPDIQADLSEIYSHISTHFQSVLSDVDDAMSEIQSFVRNAWNTISTSVSSILSTIAGVVASKWAEIQTTITTIMETISTVIVAGWELIRGAVEVAIEAVRGVVEAKFNQIQSTVETVMAAILTVATSAWEAIRAAVEEKINAAMDIVRSWGKELAKFFEGLKETVSTAARSIGSSIVDGIRSGLEAGWAALKDWAMGLIRDLLAAMKAQIKPGSPSRVARDEIGIPIMQGISEGLTQELPNTIKTAQSSAQAIIAAFMGGGGAPGGGVPFWAGLPGVIGGIFGVISRMTKDNTDDVVSHIDGLVGAVKTNLTALDGWIRGWINDVVAHRTELLFRFNYAAWQRGEGTKVLPELQSVTEKFIRNTTEAAAKAGEQLKQIARNLQEDIRAAREEATKAAETAVAAAASQVRQLQLNASLQREIKMQREAFATLQADQKAYFDRSQTLLQDRLRQQEGIARAHFVANLRLSRVGQAENPAVAAAQETLDTQTELFRIEYARSRDLQRAKTDDEIAEINARADEEKQALSDRIAEEKAVIEAMAQYRINLQKAQIEAERDQALQGLRDAQAQELYIERETMALRQEITERERAFNEEVRRQQEVFEASMEAAAMQRAINNIYAERDERVKAISDALQEKERQLTEAAQKEREAILEQLAQQLEDYKKNYIDEIVAAFHHAQVDIADFLGDIDQLAKNVGRTLNDEVVRMLNQIDDLRHTLGDAPTFIPQGPRAPIPSPIMPLPFNPSSSIIGRMPNEISRPSIIINNNIQTTQPVTARQINDEINRSISLAR